MVRKGATEAKAMAAAAADGRNDVVEFRGRDMTFYGIFAVWSGTPFEVIIVVDIDSVK